MCKYCDGEENIKISGGWCGTDGATISNAKLSVEISYETACMNINYCPVCGRNLILPKPCKHVYKIVEIEQLEFDGTLIIHEKCEKCGHKRYKLEEK